MAVGDHLILGGDNLDLALAEFLEQQAAQGKKLSSQQWEVLVRSCRRVKETLLGDDAPAELTVNLPSSGTRLIGGGSQINVSREQVRGLLEQALSDEDDWIRWKAVKGLSELGLAGSSQAVAALTDDPDFQVRFEVAAALRR